MTFEDIKAALLTVTPNVYHFDATGAEGNYIVWAEDGQADASYGDDHVIDQVLEGTVDYFTKTEYDPVFGQIQSALNNLDLVWRLNSIQYEEDTGYIHYEWVWEMMSDG